MTEHADATRIDRLLSRVADVEKIHTERRVARPLEPDDYDDVESGLDLERVRLVRWHSVIPRRFHDADLTGFDPEVYDALVAWARRPAGRNLVLIGPVGTGKTHAAVAACRVAHWSGLGVRFLPVVELLDLLRPGGPENALYDLADVDRLILDDVGSERPTEWTAERLYALLNRRWLEVAPTIVTTNLAPADLEESIGARLFSRLVGNDAVVLALYGNDRRRA